MTGIVADMRYGAFYGMKSAVTSLSARQDSLQSQVSSGVKSSDYAGLGASRTQALALQPALTQVSAWSANVQTAQAQLSVGQDALKQITSLSSDLTASISSLVGTPTASSVASAAQSARSSLTLLGSLLNTQSGGSYVFSGQSTTVAPATGDLASSSMLKTIGALVSQLGGQSTAQDVLQNTLQTAGTTGNGSPLSSVVWGAQKVSVGSSITQTIGWVATQSGTASSETTGSPIRDLMRNLMVVASLGSVQTGSDDYNSLVSGLQTSNNTVNAGLADVASNLGVQQTALSSQSSFLTQISSSLTTQLSVAKDADIATVSTQLTDTQNQLQASYSMIADMKSMTLANYI